MHEHNNRNRTKWIKQNSIKQYKTKNIVHLIKGKKLFGQPTIYIMCHQLHYHTYTIIVTALKTNSITKFLYPD